MSHSANSATAISQQDPVSAMPRRQQLDLMATYGTDKLTMHQQFATGSAATRYIEDYCFNANKNARLAYGSGTYNKYACDCSACPWEIVVSRRKLADGTRCMLVTKLSDEHDDFCTSVAKAKQRQIAALAMFVAAVRTDKGTCQLRALFSLLHLYSDVSQRVLTIFPFGKRQKRSASC